jgi:cytochrome P450
MMNQYGEFAKETHLGDLFPILSNIDYNGFVKRMKTLSKNMDLFLQRLIDEHRADRDRNTMVSHLLTLQEAQPQSYTDSIIKGLIMVSFSSDFNVIHQNHKFLSISFLNF